MFGVIKWACLHYLLSAKGQLRYINYGWKQIEHPWYVFKSTSLRNLWEGRDRTSEKGENENIIIFINPLIFKWIHSMIWCFIPIIWTYVKCPDKGKMHFCTFHLWNLLIYSIYVFHLTSADLRHPILYWEALGFSHKCVIFSSKKHLHLQGAIYSLLPVVPYFIYPVK